MLFFYPRLNLLPSRHLILLIPQLIFISWSVSWHSFHIDNFIMLIFSTLENQMKSLSNVQSSNFVDFWTYPLKAYTILYFFQFSPWYCLHDNQHEQNYVSLTSQKMFLPQALQSLDLIYEDDQHKMLLVILMQKFILRLNHLFKDKALGISHLDF